MQKSGENDELSPEDLERVEAFIAEVKRLWPGAELVAVREPDVLDRP